MGTIISVFNQKGGVAKTTTTTNLAAALSKEKKKVLIVDSDPQANSTNALGIDDESLDETIYTLLTEEKKPKKERIKEVIMKTSFEYLDLLPSNISLSDAEIQLSNVFSREAILNKILGQIKEDYDYIIIDCPPSLGLLSVNALVASDELIIPVSTSFFSIKGIKHLINTIELAKEDLNPKLNIMGVLITMYDKRENISKEIKAILEEAFGEKIFKTLIRVNSQIKYSQENQKPVIFYNDDCNAYFDYTDLAKEVLQHER